MSVSVSAQVTLPGSGTDLDQSWYGRPLSVWAVCTKFSRNLSSTVRPETRRGTDKPAALRGRVTYAHFAENTYRCRLSVSIFLIDQAVLSFRCHRTDWFSNERTAIYRHPLVTHFCFCRRNAQELPRSLPGTTVFYFPLASAFVKKSFQHETEKGNHIQKFLRVVESIYFSSVFAS